MILFQKEWGYLGPDFEIGLNIALMFGFKYERDEGTFEINFGPLYFWLNW